MSPDLEVDTLAAFLPDRPLRCYPALVSTEADAMAWARAGGPSGAVVVADYQASARGRAGWPWTVRPGESLGFSVLLRGGCRVEDEGWLWAVASLALADSLGDRARIRWPDAAHTGEADGAENIEGSVAVIAEPGAGWAVLSILVGEVVRPRGLLLGQVVAAVERLIDTPRGVVLAAYRDRCSTLGRRVRARLVPLGPAGVVVAGTAEEVRDDGTLAIRTEDGRRVAVRPSHLGILDVD